MSNDIYLGSVQNSGWVRCPAKCS